MIFLDTGYFQGLMNHKDTNHKNSLEIQEYLKESNEKTVINTTVLVETLNRSIKTNILAENMFKILKQNHQIIKLTTAIIINPYKLINTLGTQLIIVIAQLFTLCLKEV